MSSAGIYLDFKFNLLHFSPVDTGRSNSGWDRDSICCTKLSPWGETEERGMSQKLQKKPSSCRSHRPFCFRSLLVKFWLLSQVWCSSTFRVRQCLLLMQMPVALTGVILNPQNQAELPWSAACRGGCHPNTQTGCNSLGGHSNCLVSRWHTSTAFGIRVNMACMCCTIASGSTTYLTVQLCLMLSLSFLQSI